MVTSYYIMCMSKKKQKIEIDDYYDNLFRTSKTQKVIDNKCRICLQGGKVPIFGNEIMPELPELLSCFGQIQLNEDDEYPKFLCDVCLQFVKEAILFRKAAKRTDDLLKQPTEENISLSHENSDIDEGNANDNDLLLEDAIWNNAETSDLIKTQERKGNIKYSTKITCNICNKIINRSYYKEHMTMHDPDHQKYVCEICGKFFRLRCAYHNHRLRHRSDFPYKCQFCPYRGRYAELLKNHMRTHTGDYRYMCTECPARFLFKSNLNSHVRKHKEPQFKCDTCKRAFHTKLTLQRHFEADHLGIKNHVCSICGKAFGYRNAMMKHQRYVHKREKLLYGRMPSYLKDQQKQQEINK